MRESDAVLLIYLPLTLLLYVLFAGRYLSAFMSRPPPRRLHGHIERVFPGTRPSRRTAFGAYVGWTAFTQLVPVVIVLSDSIRLLRAASALELVAAVGWTGYLLRRR